MDRLPFYELEELLDSLKMLNEKEEEERKKKESGEKSPSFNMSSLSRQMSSMNTSGIKTPSLPNFKL